MFEILNSYAGWDQVIVAQKPHFCLKMTQVYLIYAACKFSLTFRSISRTVRRSESFVPVLPGRTSVRNPVLIQ